MNLLPLHTLITQYENLHRDDDKIIELVKQCHRDLQCWNWIVEQIGFDPYEEEEEYHEDDEEWTEEEAYFGLGEFLVCEVGDELLDKLLDKLT